jgi:DNA-binding MarR family transcriptional regulator
MAIVTFLLSVTLVALILYYRRIKDAQKEYEKARDLVSDVIISVNKDLQRQSERLSSVSAKTDTTIYETQKNTNKLKEDNTRLAKIESDIMSFSEIEPKVSAQIREIDKKVENLITTQKKLEQQISEAEKFKQRIKEQAEAKIEAAIPIRQEKALAPLTPTELSVLEILANEDRKTAPEIKGKTNLTREHTARLMKKLYEDGYLERDTSKIPFAYSLKEEMRRILKKIPESV